MWQSIQAHDQVVDHFRRSLAAGRLASSYLFLGPAGIGKRTFAEQLAKNLLCASPRAANLEATCDSCESCRLLAAGNHPDLDLVGLPAGKRELPVGLFIGDREHRNQAGLCHNVALRPRLGRRRVAIIDDADQLNTESANCLLKTLEEPPPGAVLILIGTNRAAQLPTILSRTQVIRFAPLPTEVVRQLLLEQELITDPSAASRLAEISGGSLRRAVALSDPDLDSIQQQLEQQLAPGRLQCHPLAASLTAFVQQAGKEAHQRRGRMRLILQLASQHFRQQLRAACGLTPPAGSTPATAVTWGPETAVAAVDRCLEAEIELDRNANQNTLLECWLDDLAEIFVRAVGAPTK